MKTFNRHHAKVLPIALACLGVFGATAASAENDAQSADTNSSCQREVRRVAVWPHGSPKAPQFARFENREVTICDGKVVSQQKPASASTQG